MLEMEAHIRVIAFVVSAFIAFQSECKNYFADGYHGGIYGHYPVAWKTQFIVDNLKKNQNWKIGLEIEPETWDSVRSQTPEAYESFKEMMSEGRIEYTNPTYAQPYCYNISGESLIRQFQYGIRKLRSHFPEITFTSYSCEEPCFTSCLPAILDGFGCKYISLKCPDTCWGGYMAPMGGEFIMLEGPDGTCIPAVPRYDCEDLEKNSVWQTIGWRNSKHYINACLQQGIKNPIGMCYQDAGWRNGPWIGAKPWNSEYVLWKEYFENNMPESGIPVRKFSQDDVRGSLMWGSQVLQKLARNVRKAENVIVTAEKISAMAGVFTPEYNTSAEIFDECWRRLLLSQHHDCWIVPYNGLWKFGTWADAVKLWTSGAINDARAQIEAAVASINPGEEEMIKVFNVSLNPKTQIVELEIKDDFIPEGSVVRLKDDKGDSHYAYVIERYVGNENNSGNINKVKRLLFKATVPPLGYKSYKIVKEKAPEAPGEAEAEYEYGIYGYDDFRMANDVIELVLDMTKGGTVKSLKLPRKGNPDFVEEGDSEYSFGELRGFFYDEDRYRSSKEARARIVKQIDTPFLKSVTIEGEIAGNIFRQTYTIREGQEKIDCNLKIFWNGNPGIGEFRQQKWNEDRRGYNDDRFKLCYLMPTSFPQERLLKDAPFDVCESLKEANYYNRWSEIKNNVILNWIDVSESSTGRGIGLITDHTGSFVYGPDYPTALTLQYSGPGLWGRNYSITENMDIDFSIVPHVGISGETIMTEESDDFNEPLLAMISKGSGAPDSGSIAGSVGDGLRLSAFVKNPDGSFMMRIHNVYSDPSCGVELKLQHSEVYTADLDGRPEGIIKVKDGRCGLDINRNGIRTLIIKI